MSVKDITITISVGRSDELSNEECAEVARKFVSAVDTIAAQIKAGALTAVPLRFKVGENPELEPVCRICGRSESTLKQLGITLFPYDPTQFGVRPQLEAAKPSDRIVYWTCGCEIRQQQRKAEADRAAWEKRSPLAPTYFASPKSASVDEVDAMKVTIEALKNRLAKLEAEDGPSQ